jgi:type I restriction enzyme M protein
MHKPSWFKKDQVLVSFAPTCGIYKKGEERFKIDAATGKRTVEIDDLLSEDVKAVFSGQSTDTLRWVSRESLQTGTPIVPVYFDDRPVHAFASELEATWPGYEAVTLGELIEAGKLFVRPGHGSPSADVRTGAIPYIKVSDIRAGQININPTNRVTEVVARHHWGGGESGLKGFDLVTPNRASKNIGEVAIVMPGQERIVLTKEVFVFRPTDAAGFDSFYLMWAMTLRIVREQWRRIVFMQTNREVVGSRFREIQIPLAPSEEEGRDVSAAFREYYNGIATLRKNFLEYIEKDDQHHVFFASAGLDAADDQLEGEGETVGEEEAVEGEESDAIELETELGIQ